jgi:hypothetical protein
MINKKRRKLTGIAAIALLVLAGTTNVATLRAAQTTTGTILGTLRDSTGAVVGGGQVVIKNVNTGQERTVTTTEAGEFFIPEVPVGSYEVTASKSNFRTEVRSGVTVTVGAILSVNFDLLVGEAEEKMEVVADSGMVDTSTSSVRGLVNDHVIRDLPLNGRDWLQLATLQPGVVFVTSQTSSITNTGQGQRGNGLELSIAGGRPTNNVYRVDGLVVNDYSNASPGSALGVNLGVDAIQEF